jgi:spermidine synthase
MLPWTVVDQALTPDGTALVLARRGDEWEISAGGYTLMSSRLHGSEEALAHLALERAPGVRAVLLGGLGLGYSLRAALDRLPASGRVTVAELSPAVVEWNRTHVAGLARRPLDDARVHVQVCDVLGVIRQAAAAWDLILLDVDNGPGAIAQSSNSDLYDAAGIRSCRRALRAGGVLGVWSAVPDEGYLRRLRDGGFEASAHPVRARRGGRKKHVVFVAATRPAPALSIAGP